MFLTRDEARALDRRAMEEFGIPGAVLMENAGRGMAELLRSLGIQGLVVVCCGKGNNGGDGFVLARHLDNARIPVRVLLFARPASLTGDAAMNYRLLERGAVSRRIVESPSVDEEMLRTELAAADWVVDALFGSGLRGPVQAPFDRIITAINASGARVLAADNPSGLDSDTGQPHGTTIRAHHTATIIALHPGSREPTALPYLGQVHVIDIGIPRRVFEFRQH